jgi:hypothetical protein
MDLVRRPEPDLGTTNEALVGRGQAPTGPEFRDACALNHVVSALRWAPAPQSVRGMVPYHAVAGPVRACSGALRSR